MNLDVHTAVNMKDYLGKDVSVGDTVVMIVGKHFKTGIIEANLGWGYVKIKGIKTEIPTNKLIKK